MVETQKSIPNPAHTYPLDAPIILLAPDYVPISIPMSIPNLSQVVSYHIIQVLLEASVRLAPRNRRRTDDVRA